LIGKFVCGRAIPHIPNMFVLAHALAVVAPLADHFRKLPPMVRLVPEFEIS